MRSRTRTAFLLALALLFAVPSWAQIEQRCVLMVDRFQDPAELPQFHPVFDQALTVDNLLTFDIDTSSPVSQAGLAFQLLDGPPGMTIDPASGVVTWAPSELQVGTISATVMVTDADQRRNRHTFCVSVIDPNAAPLIAALADRTVLADEPVSFIVDASDPDPGDQLSFSLVAAPAGMSIQAGSGLVEWLPQAGDIGSASVSVRAIDDGGRFDTESLTITVVADNAPPELAPIEDRGARPGVALQLQPIATDPDDPVLAWRLLAAPAGMTIDAVTGRIDWTPALPQLGAHAVSVEVADPLGFADTADFEVLVDLNRPPVAVDDSGFRVERGETLVVSAPGVLGNDSDPNSDPLSALLVDPPQRGVLSLDAVGGFEYTPDAPVGTISLVETLAYERANGASTWTPLIGNLDDDPQSELIIGDGSGCCTGFLIAIDGISGLEEWLVTLPGRQLDMTSKPALADIDLDGRPEILIVGGEADGSPTAHLRIYAFEHDGQLKWISEDLPEIFYLDGVRRGNRQLGSAAITVADLDQDGLPEILVAPDFGPAGYHVFDHEGLTLDVVHEPGTTIADAAPTRVTVVDLDLDGDPEIVVGNVAWSHDGEMLWKRIDNFGHSWATTFPLVANLDDDPFPELVRTRGGLSGPGNIVAWNHDGSDLMTPAGVPWEVARPFGFNTAPISIADVDADGYADVLLPLPNDVNVFEVLDGRDGSVKWSKSVTTRSMGATVFDMDRDGFVEVLFIDESSNLYVWDGRDGAEKLVLPMNNPRPDNHTIPVFADIDADGASELVVPGGFSFGFDTALSIWESPNDDWAPMRSIWNEHRYHVTNVNDDLTIPAQEQPHWLLPGLNQAMINQRLPEERLESTDAFTYRASDGALVSNLAEVTIEVLPPNSPPRILSTPPRLASPGFEYAYPILAVDADPGELLQFAIAEGPPGMSVGANGRVIWSPGAGDIGPHTVVISVTDTLGTPAYQNFVLDVVAPVTVPTLTGLSETAAIMALETVSLRADPLRDVFSDTVAVGEVAAQSPSAGTSIAAGAGVTVEVSRGPVPVGVPRLVGLDIDDALGRLSNVGLSAFPLEWVNDPQVPRGVVKQQDPPPNARVSPGSDVAIVVSGGPRAVIEIDPPLIVSGGSAGVSVEVRDVDGAPLDPQPAVSLSLDFAAGEMLGTPPSLDGTSVVTAADSRGAFRLEAAFDVGQPETLSVEAAVLPPLSDGPGGAVYSDFTRQQAEFEVLITALIEALDAGDQPAVEALFDQLGDLEAAIDLRRLRTMTAIAPEGGMPPTPAQAIAGGLATSVDDIAYVNVSLELVEHLQLIDELMRAGDVPDPVLNEVNQDLLAIVAARTTLSPSAVGVLRASPSVTALLGTFAPRVLVADIRAVRQALRDEGWIGPNATATPRFTLPGLMSAVRIRNNMLKDTYLPYLGEVAWAMGVVIAADLLQEYANASAIVGIISGASQSFHAFHIPNSVIEGFGFDPTLSPNNAVTIIGPSLLQAASDAASGLSSAGDIKDVNTAMDAIQTQLDNANALEAAWDDANSIPMGVTRGCILVTTPGCRQLQYPDGFASVYDAEGLLNLPAPVLIIVRNLESGGTAVFVANFVAYEGDDD